MKAKKQFNLHLMSNQASWPPGKSCCCHALPHHACTCAGCSAAEQAVSASRAETFANGRSTARAGRPSGRHTLRTVPRCTTDSSGACKAEVAFPKWL